MEVEDLDDINGGGTTATRVIEVSSNNNMEDLGDEGIGISPKKTVAFRFKPDHEARAAMDEAQIEEFLEAFRVFDVDNGGTIDTQEFASLCTMLGLSLTAEELTEVFIKMDGDEDGELEFEEFLVLMATLMKAEDSSDDLKLAFEQIDEIGTGSIPVSVVSRLLGHIAENCTSKEIDSLLDICDSDGDGLVSFDDIQRLLSVDRML